MDLQEKTQSLLNASRAVLEFESFETAAQKIFDEAKKVTGALSGYVALLSDDGSENEVLFLDSGGLDCTVDPELPMPIRGLRSQAYKTGKAVYDNTFMDSKWMKYMPKGHVMLKNVMFAPLNIQNKTVGLMGLANKEGKFNDDDAQFATMFGEYAALALFNSQNLDKLKQTVKELKKALNEVKHLRGLLPMCSWCKKIRNDDGYWERVDAYITNELDVKITHGMCRECAEKVSKETDETEVN